MTDKTFGPLLRRLQLDEMLDISEAYEEDRITVMAMKRLVRHTARALELATPLELSDHSQSKLMSLAEDMSHAVDRFRQVDGDDRSELVVHNLGRARGTVMAIRDDPAWGASPETRAAIVDTLTRGVEDVELVYELRNRLASTLKVVEAARTSAEEGARQADVSVGLAKAAASEAATSALESSFDTVANDENRAARDWRRATLLVLGLVVVGSSVFLIETLGREIGWQGAVFRLAVVSALAAIAAYLARQSSHHRRIATWARSIQVQLKSFRGFVEKIDDQKVQDAMFELFTRRVLAPPPESRRSDEVTNLVQPLLEQVIKRAP